MLVYFRGVGPDRYRYRAIILFAGRSIFKDCRPSTDYERKLDEHAMKMITHPILTTLILTASVGLIMVGQAYAYIVDGVYALPTGLIVPFVDPNTDRGFAINLIVQSATAFTVSLSIIATEAIACIINNTFIVMADMVCFNMRKFSDNLRQKSFTHQNKMELRNIFVQLQDMEAYLEELNRVYYWKFFLQPILTTGCVSLGIFSQIVVGVAPRPISSST